MDFRELDLPEPVLRGIEAVGFVTCTPIQEAALPVALKGKDVAGQSQTGTGKTAAFLIAAFTRLLTRPVPARRGPRMLIVAPTRELAVQIEHDARTLGQFTRLRTLAVYGGVDYEKQREALRQTPDLLVGTPGRLIDYLKQGVWSPRHVEVLVIDEADRMFDMGFIDDIRYILRRLPPPEKRQSFLFSATLSFRVMELTYEFMNAPTQITVTPEQVTAEKVEQVLYHVGRHEKFGLLLGLLQRERAQRVLLFTNTRDQARVLEERLRRNGHGVRAMTGNLDQRSRLRILADFKEGRLPILVATDVASRGLHIEGVTHVVNWDLPQDSEDYVHRIGRTARAGATGKAISLVDETTAFFLENVESFIGQKIRVEWAGDDLFLPEVRRTPEERIRAQGGRGPKGQPHGRDKRRRETHPTQGAAKPGGPAGPAPSGQGTGKRPRRRRRKGGGSAPTEAG